MQITDDTVVSITFELHDSKGNLLEKSTEPISYLHGDYGNIFPLVEHALDDKEAGASVSVTLQPEDAFGEYDPELVRIEDLSRFPDDVEVGMQFEGQGEGSGETRLYTITDIAAGKAVVDGNHPLAGQVLVFSCTVTAVRPATAEEIEHEHVHDQGCHH
jgi:FKBP-type peptidyl-prolyl cis-trans isomerase SlyD